MLDCTDIYGRAGRVAAALVVGLCAGCGPDDPSPPPEPAQGTACVDQDPPVSGRPTALLGHDSGDGFLAFQPNADLNLNFGPQGGQHVYVSLLLFAPTATRWTLDFDFVAEGSEDSAGNGGAVIDTCASGWTESLNQTVFIYSYSGGEQAGVITLSATAEGLAADAEATVVLRP